MKCEGRPTYTQFSRAFPHSHGRKNVLDELLISFEAQDDGGVHAEFRIEWVDLGVRYPLGTACISCFTDGLAALLDPRITCVLRALSSRVVSNEISVDEVIDLLERNGVVASKYHEAGGNA